MCINWEISIEGIIQIVIMVIIGVLATFFTQKWNEKKKNFEQKQQINEVYSHMKYLLTDSNIEDWKLRRIYKAISNFPELLLVQFGIFIIETIDELHFLSKDKNLKIDHFPILLLEYDNRNKFIFAFSNSFELGSSLFIYGLAGNVDIVELPDIVVCAKKPIEQDQIKDYYLDVFKSMAKTFGLTLKDRSGIKNRKRSKIGQKFRKRQSEPVLKKLKILFMKLLNNIDIKDELSSIKRSKEYINFVRVGIEIDEISQSGDSFDGTPKKITLKIDQKFYFDGKKWFDLEIIKNEKQKYLEQGKEIDRKKISQKGIITINKKNLEKILIDYTKYLKIPIKEIRLRIYPKRFCTKDNFFCDVIQYFLWKMENLWNLLKRNHQ